MICCYSYSSVIIFVDGEYCIYMPTGEIPICVTRQPYRDDILLYKLDCGILLFATTLIGLELQSH